jgi:hypothetical protein
LDALAGSNHTLIPTARKEQSKPCGIFARRSGAAADSPPGGLQAAIRANFHVKSLQIATVRWFGYGITL